MFPVIFIIKQLLQSVHVCEFAMFQQKELTSTYKQMENDIQLYQSQLEAEKKMQVDLEKELQSSFNEITKLTSLIDGRVPKGIS